MERIFPPDICRLNMIYTDHDRWLLPRIVWYDANKLFVVVSILIHTVTMWLSLCATTINYVDKLMSLQCSYVRCSISILLTTTLLQFEAGKATPLYFQ